MSTLRVNTVTDQAGTGRASAGQFGFGQTWQNVTGSRALGVTYTNTTNQTILFSVQCSIASGGSMNISVNSNVIRACSNGGGGSATFSLDAPVPPGATYSASGGTLSSWTELRA